MPKAQASKETVNVGGQPPVTPAPTAPAPTAPATPTVASVPEVAGFAGSKAEIAKNRAYYRNKMGIADTVPNTNYVSSVAPDVENPKTAEQNAQEADWNARQAAFDALNPAGTKQSEVISPTPEQAREVYAAMNAPTPATTPKAPTAPTATAPKAPKAGETVDFNTSAGREGEITDNLNRFYAEGAKDLDTLKKMAGYDTADQGKKNLIDAFWKSKQPKTTSDYFRGLLTNEIRKPEDWKSPEYVNATKQFAAFNQFKNSTGVQIEAAVKSGALTEGSDAFRALEQANPNAIAQYRQAKANRVASENLNGYTEGLYNSMNGVNAYDKNKSTEAQTRQPSPVEEFLQSLSDRLTKNETPDYAKQWRGKISENPEAVRLSKEVAEKTAELRRLNTEEVELENTIKARYAGTGADKAYIDAKIREGLKGIYSAKNEANISLQAAQSQLSAMTENAKTELDFQMKQDETRRAQERELRGYEAEFAKMDYQQELALETARKQFEQKMEQQAQMAKDPVLATQAVIDQYRQKGVFAERSDAEIIADIESQVAGGKTLGQALTDLNKAFQSKPEYKALTTPKAEAKEFGFQNVGGGIIAVTDPKTGAVTFRNASGETVTGEYPQATGLDFRQYALKYPNEASVKNNNPAGITWNANFDTGRGFAAVLKDAGIEFTKGTARPTAEGGNYVQFKNVADGMKAYDLLWSGSNYQNLTVQQALNRWGTGSLALWPINPNAKISSLSQSQLDALKVSQLAKESPGFLKELKASGVIKGGTIDRGALAETATEAFDKTAYDKVFKAKIIAGASKLSDKERENMNAQMEQALKTGDKQYAAELIRGLMVNDKRVGDTVYDNAELKTGLENLKGLLTNYKASGWNTGVLRSMAEKVANFAGTTTDTELAKAKNQLWVLVADYIRAISGTAASDVEVARLLQNMPQIKNVDSFNMTILDNLANIADRRVKSGIDTFLGSYKNIAPDIFPEFYGKGTESKGNQLPTDLATKFKNAGYDDASIREWASKNWYAY